MNLNIVLVEPQIPQNTGNISRTCAVTGAKLHLVKPMGFEVTDKNLKRAGLDYWDKLDITYYDNLADFFEKNKGGKFYYFTRLEETYRQNWFWNTKVGRWIYDFLGYRTYGSMFVQEETPDGYQV